MKTLYDFRFLCWFIVALAPFLIGGLGIVIAHWLT